MSIEPVPQAPGPAYEQVARSVREAILTGRLSDGERLPSEVALARQTGVSRSTVREALRLLEESGVVERVSPKIVVARSGTKLPAFRVIDHALRRRTVTFGALQEALLLLEPELARLAALRRDDSDLVALREILDEQHAHARDYDVWCRLDNEFHVAIAEASANAPLVLARASLGQVLIPSVALFVTDERATKAAMVFHERLYSEIAARDCEVAEVVARRHVEDFHAAWERSGLDYHRDVSRVIDEAIGVREKTPEARA